jgi:hypothetical protein
LKHLTPRGIQQQRHEIYRIVLRAVQYMLSLNPLAAGTLICNQFINEDLTMNQKIHMALIVFNALQDHSTLSLDEMDNLLFKNIFIN